MTPHMISGAIPGPQLRDEALRMCDVPPRLGGLGLYSGSRMTDAAWLGFGAHRWARMRRLIPTIREVSLKSDDL